MKSFDNLIDSTGITNLNGVVLMLENSNYVKLFRAQNSELFKDHEIKHFIIISSDVITEILSLSNPIIKVIR